MLTKGHKRKQQIIDAAKDMFIKYGYQSTHIGKICDELDIARGTVYQYFSNKREILYSILESLEEEIADLVDADDLKDHLKTNPSQKIFISYVNGRIASALMAIINEPIILKLIFKDIVGIDKGVISRVDGFIENIIKAITLDIEEMNKKGFCRKGINSEETAMVVMGGMLFTVKNNNNRQKARFEKSELEALIDNYFKGIFK
jgi:AcrR family transcriptional regulator